MKSLSCQDIDISSLLDININVIKRLYLPERTCKKYSLIPMEASTKPINFN